MRVQNPRSALDNEPVQFLRSNGFPEGFAEAMQEIENERFLDLDLLVRTLQRANPPCLEVRSNYPSANRREKQSEEKSRPHRERSEEHTSELQSPDHLGFRLLLEKKKIIGLVVVIFVLVVE